LLGKGLTFFFWFFPFFPFGFPFLLLFKIHLPGLEERSSTERSGRKLQTLFYAFTVLKKVSHGNILVIYRLHKIDICVFVDL